MDNTRISDKTFFVTLGFGGYLVTIGRDRATSEWNVGALPHRRIVHVHQRLIVKGNKINFNTTREKKKTSIFLQIYYRLE